MENPTEKRSFTPDELAARWSVSTKLLATRRSRERGPAYFKVGEVVRYLVSEVVAFEKANAHRPCDTTSEPID